MTTLLGVFIQRHKSQAFWVEVELDSSDGAVTVLSDDEVGYVLPIGLGIVVRFTIDEGDNVGVLLDRTGFTEVTELRDLRAAVFNGTAEL